MITADPFNERIETFLAKITDRPVKIPELEESLLERFIVAVELKYGYDIDLEKKVVFKIKDCVKFSDEFEMPAFHLMKTLPQGVTVEKVLAGSFEKFEPLGKQKTAFTHRHSNDFYRIYCGGKLIAVES